MKKLTVYFERIARAIKERDLDWTILIFGDKGAGKSNLALLLAKMIDENFSIKRVVFTPEESMDAFLNSPQFSAIVIDEAAQTLFSRRAMSIQNVEQIRSLMQIRAGRHYCIFICIPDIAQVDSYIRNFEARTVIEAFMRENRNGLPDKGYCFVYNRDKIMEFKRDQTGKIVPPRPSFSETFPALHTLNIEGKQLWAEYLEHAGAYRMDKMPKRLLKMMGTEKKKVDKRYTSPEKLEIIERLVSEGKTDIKTVTQEAQVSEPTAIKYIYYYKHKLNILTDKSISSKNLNSTTQI